MRQDLTQADSDLLSETLNETLLAWICRRAQGLNLVYRQIKDLKALAETDKIVFDMGFDLRMRIRCAPNMAMAGASGRRRAPLAPPCPWRLHRPALRRQRPRRSGRCAGRLIDAEQAQWRPVMEPLVEPIRVLLADAAARQQSAAELLERLPEGYWPSWMPIRWRPLTRTAFAATSGRRCWPAKRVSLCQPLPTSLSFRNSCRKRRRFG